MRIDLFDKSGRPVASGATPVLGRAVGYGSSGPLVGGVYAGALANVLGADFVPSIGRPDFQGTLVLSGFAEGKIAPEAFTFAATSENVQTISPGNTIGLPSLG